MTAPSAPIAAAALREPALDVEETVAERERRARRAARGRLRLPRLAPGTSCSSTCRTRTSSARSSPSQGLSCAATRTGSASRCACPRRTTGSSPRSASRPSRRSGALRPRRAHDDGDGAAHLARPRRPRPRARRHRRRLPRPPAHAASPSTASSTSSCSPAATSTSTSTTRSRTSSPRSAMRFEQALGGARGLVRYGTATVPMDEARGFASIDLVNRPHAEMQLAFTRRPRRRPRADAAPARAGALRRCEGGFTLHVEASGERRPPRRRGGVQGPRPRAGEACARQRLRRGQLDEGR